MSLKLWQQCRQFYEDRGVYMPLMGTQEGDEAYRLWSTWEFGNLSGNNPQAQAEAMARIEAWESRP